MSESDALGQVGRAPLQPAENAQASKKKAPKRPPVTAFQNKQLSLFQTFLCNTDAQRGALSNAIDLWDSIPRYSVSRQMMSKLRSPTGNLKLLKLDFEYASRSLRVIIRPARLERKNKQGQIVEMDFYPSAAEELVEDALRKLATDQQQGFFDQSQSKSGVLFTLHALRKELKKRGHSRSFYEIVDSLRILAFSNIEILEGDGTEGAVGVSPYLPVLAGVTRKDLAADPDAKWIAHFHPFVTRSINQLTYRQFNYQQLMSHNSQLARWLHKQLVLKFFFAAHGRTFEMYFSTIKRDSKLLDAYALTRQAVKAVDEAFQELVQEKKVLMELQKREKRGPRNKLIDVIYTLSPSLDFIAEAKAANKRKKDGQNVVGEAVDNFSSEAFLR